MYFFKSFFSIGCCTCRNEQQNHFIPKLTFPFATYFPRFFIIGIGNLIINRNVFFHQKWFMRVGNIGNVVVSNLGADCRELEVEICFFRGKSNCSSSKNIQIHGTYMAMNPAGAVQYRFIVGLCRPLIVLFIIAYFLFSF